MNYFYERRSSMNINGADLSQFDILFSLTVVFIVFSAVYKGILQVLEMLNLFHRKKKKGEEEICNIKSIMDDLVSMKDVINEIADTNRKTIESLKLSTRHAIVRSCEEYLEKGSIEHYELMALNDLYQSYKDNLNGNSYATDMIDKVKALDVHNKHNTDTNS